MMVMRTSRTDEPSSPYGSDSFDLNESIDARTPLVVPMVSRTPKVLSSRLLGQSASSLASVDSIESSLKRSVTFSTREEHRAEWAGVIDRDASTLASQLVIPSVPLAINDSEEVPSDGEYSEDFDDAPGEGQLATSMSYAEDFEDSTLGRNTSLRIGNLGGLTVRQTGQSLGTSEAYSSNFEASGVAYSDDFETSRLSRSACPGTETVLGKPPAADIDALLSQLASKKRLPAQVCEIRYKLIDLSRTLNQPAAPSNDAATANEVVQNGIQLERQLEQLEIDLVAEERRRRMEFSERNMARRAARVRADERRAEHERQLADTERRMMVAERNESYTKQKLSEVETRLKNSEVLLKLTQKTRSDLEKGNMLRDQEITDLKLRSSIIAAESGTASKESTLKVKILEEAMKIDKMKQDIEVTVLRDAIKAVEQRHSKEINKLPEDHKRILFTLDKEKLEIAKYKAKLDTENNIREKRFENESQRTSQRSEQELAAGRAALDACRLIGDAANRRERERLACLQSALQAERANIARDRSALDMIRSTLNEESVELRTKLNALEPRFKDASELERCARAREKAAIKAEDDVCNTVAQIRLIEVDVKKREAAANEAKLAATMATQRAELMIRDATTRLVQCKQRSVQVERSKFAIFQQQAALARLVIAIRIALDTIKQVPKNSSEAIQAQSLATHYRQPHLDYTKTIDSKAQHWPRQRLHTKNHSCQLYRPWPMLPPPPPPPPLA